MCEKKYKCKKNNVHAIYKIKVKRNVHTPDFLASCANHELFLLADLLKKDQRKKKIQMCFRVKEAERRKFCNCYN